MSDLTTRTLKTAKTRGKQCALIRDAFKKLYEPRFGNVSPHVYECPAGYWVVIADDVAWVAGNDAEEFVFVGRKEMTISFQIPEGWPV